MRNRFFSLLSIDLLSLLGTVAFCVPSLHAQQPAAFSESPRDARAAAEQPQRLDVASATVGIVTLCSDSSVVHRDGHAFRLVRGSGIQLNDLVQSGEAGPLAVSFFNGSTVTLNRSTTTQFTTHQESNHVQLVNGEVRIVHDGTSRLFLTSPQLQVLVGRALVRAQQSNNAGFIKVEAGKTYFASQETLQELQLGQCYETKNRNLIACAEPTWQINVSEVRLASALQSAPVLQAPGAASNTANQSANASTNQNAAPNANANANNANTPPANSTALNEEEERRRRLQQQTQPAATRGGTVQANRGTATPASTGSSSLSLGNFSGALGLFASGGLAADAGQQTFQGRLDNTATPFPGQIHLATTETRNTFSSVQLNAAEQASLSGNHYYSIGVGPAPTSQVVTNAGTASNPTPTAIAIPQFNAHIVKLDQYGAVDSALDPAAGLAANAGITGLVGASPTGPVIVGTAPLLDNRGASFNPRATFALGEFRVSTAPDGTFSLAARSSDQDRTIVKDINGNDANDVVVANPDVTFTDTVDARFLPQSPTVKTPTALNNRVTNYAGLDNMRRAAFTTVLAESLKDYAMRTGQTRFVVDGQIVDISGYKP